MPSKLSATLSPQPDDDVPRFDFNWQTVYRFKEPKFVPKGTVDANAEALVGYLEAHIEQGPRLEAQLGELATLAESYAALVFAIAMNVFVYWKSDSLALRANGARELAPGEQPRLQSIVALLATLFAGYACDWRSRRWVARNDSPYAVEIDEIAERLPGAYRE